MSFHRSTALVASMVAAAVAFAGCAHATFEPRIVPEGPKEVAPMLEAARSLGPADLSRVWVSMGQLPPGVRLVDEELVVTNPSYELLGHVSTRLEPLDGLAAGLAVGFYRYHPTERWRNPYCNVQVPLGWVTLGLWSMVPVHYPCVVSEGSLPTAVKRREARILEALVRGAAAAGGNLLIVTSLSDLRLTTVTWYGSYSQTISTIAGEGFALRDKTRDGSAAPEP